MSSQHNNHVHPCGPGRVSIAFGMSKGLGGQIARTVQKRLKLPRRMKRRGQLRFANELILFNSWRAYRVQRTVKELVVVKYSRTAADYGRRGRYGKGQLSYDAMMQAFEEMESAGYITQEKTRPGFFRRRSFFWPTQMLTSFFSGPAAAKPTIKVYDKEVIRLLNAKKREMDYQDNGATNSMRLGVRRLNADNRRHSFSLRLPTNMIVAAYSSTQIQHHGAGQNCQTVSYLTTHGKDPGRDPDREFVFSDFEIQQAQQLIYPVTGISITPVSGYGQVNTTRIGKGGGNVSASTRTVFPVVGKRTSFLFNAISAFFDLHTLSISIPIDDLMPCTRNFSRGSLNMGGRFYCEAQSIPKDIRAHLLIDEEPTVEPDYLANHVFMLYAGLGEQLTSDPYLQVSLPGFKDAKLLRKAAKTALMILINATDKQKAKKALVRRQRRRKLILEAGFTVDDLVGAIERDHAQLTQFFYSDKGVELQYRDSQVAARIFSRFVAAGKPIFGLHDGFRVKVEDEAILREEMMSAFKKEVGVYPIIQP